MKTCKKILASVLVLAMMLSMCAFVSADDVAETPATSIVYTLNSFEGETVGTSKTSGAYAQDAGTIGFGSNVGGLNLRSSSNKAAVVVKEDGEGNQYISSLHSSLGYNHRESNNEISKFVDLTAYPVICASWDIMIPAEDTYKTNARTMTVSLGANALDVSANISTAKIVIKNGVITGSEENSTVKCSNPVNYTYGSWINVRVLGWVTDAGNMQIIIYAGNDLVYAGVSKSTGTKGLATNAYDFRYTVTNPVEGGADITSETCYDNIKMEFLPATAKLSDAEIDAIAAAQKAATPEVSILEYSGANLVSNAGSASGSDVFKSTGDLKTTIVQGGATDDHSATAYEVIEDANGNYTNLTSTSYKYLPGNVRGSFTKWVQKGLGDKGTFVYSTDMKVSNFNANVLGRIGIGLDMMSADITDADGNTIKYNNKANATLYFNIGTDGKIEIINEVSEKHDFGIPSASVPGANRSEKRDVTAGEWFNVKIVLEITHGETQYEIKVYGIFDDDVILEDEFTITYTDYDKDGVSDDIHVGQFDYLIGENDKTHEETVTSFKSMSFAKNNNFDWSGINTDAWLNRIVELDLDESGNVDVYAKKGGEEGFTGGILVMAIYNAKGAVEDIITSTDLAADGTFSYEIPAAKLAGAKFVKGFVFNALTSAVPLMPHGEIALD